MRKRLVLLGCLALAPFGAVSAHAHGDSPATHDGPRLIEVAPGQAFWMSQDQITVLSEDQHKRGRCGGFFDITEHQSETPLYLEPLGFYDGRVPTEHAVVEPLLNEVQPEKLLATVNHLSAYHNRYYQSQTGVNSQHWLRDEYLRIAAAAGRTDVSVRLVEHSFLQPSVVARIEGTGEKAAEVVVLGGHADSINWSSWFPSPDDRAPGADDNASGTATVLEIFRVLIESGYKPERSIEFMAYAGEERGLLGSQDIANSYKSQLKRVVGVIQFDMTMYPGSSRQVTLINDHVHPQLTRFLGTLMDEYVKVPWGESQCGYGCSDHASWTKAGYPAAFPFEAPFSESNPNIHKLGDTVRNGLDVTFGIHFAKLGLAFAVELASGQ